MILLSLPVKSHMYDILLLVYQDAATQEFLFQFHRKDLIFLIRLSPIYTRSKTSFNVRTNLLLLSLKFQNNHKNNISSKNLSLIISNQNFNIFTLILLLIITITIITIQIMYIVLVFPFIQNWIIIFEIVTKCESSVMFIYNIKKIQ